MQLRESGEVMKLGVIMDPIQSIKIKKDSTFAMLLEARARGWEVWYMELGDLSVWGEPRATMRPLEVKDDPTGWFELGAPVEHDLPWLDVVLMRKDPPFDMEYIYATYMLELAQQGGLQVVNDPRALRDTNEKLSATWFPDCVPPTLVARSPAKIKEFLAQYPRAVLKPLDGMGGASVFFFSEGDPNVNVIMETLTDGGQRFVMAQKYLPEIVDGDKRILLIDGEPIPHALARIPPAGEFRGNLATGGKGTGVDLSERDLEICHTVGPALLDRGLIFVGLDIIGDYLTEINVTSPTCIRELDNLYSLNIAGVLLDAIKKRKKNV